MPIVLTQDLKSRLREGGVETFLHVGAPVSEQAVFEPPCSIKWMQIESAFEIGAFSYAVSGYYSHVAIGRYTSIGEQVQVGRASHPIDWVSTSPFFYLQQPLFDVGSGFPGAEDCRGHRPELPDGAAPTSFKRVEIGHDVYVGHGAFILPGVRIGDGAVVAAMAVVTRDVPPYAIVAGNPARIKRLRFPEPVVERLLASRWWRHAPWQLRGLDMADPPRALDGLEERVAGLPPHAPGRIALASLAEAGA